MANAGYFAVNDKVLKRSGGVPVALADGNAAVRGEMGEEKR